MSQTILPYGVVEIDITALESLAVSNFGGGIAKIFYLITSANFPPSYSLHQILEDSSVVLGPFTENTKVKIESCNSRVIFDYGVSPDTGIGDADTLGGQLPAYYRNATNINAGTLADARLPTTVAKLASSQNFTNTNNFKASVRVYPNTGDAILDFYDEEPGTFRSFGWIQASSDFYVEDALNNMHKIYHTGDNASLASGNGITGTFTTADAKTITVTNGIITAIT